MNDINKTTGRDLFYAATKAAFGSIPIVGSAASELFGLIVTSPLDKRRQEWMDQVSEKLIDLQEANRIDILALSQNDQFLDVILQATTYALRTSEVEKINAFKNSIISTALDETIDQSKRHLFLGLIDRFTIWHIRVIHLFDNPKKWFEDMGKTPPQLLMGSLFSVLMSAFPSLRGEDEFIDVIWRDLKDAGFHNSGDIRTMLTGEGMYEQRTTFLGKDFIKFISEK